MEKRTIQAEIACSFFGGKSVTPRCGVCAVHGGKHAHAFKQGCHIGNNTAESEPGSVASREGIVRFLCVLGGEGSLEHGCGLCVFCEEEAPARPRVQPVHRVHPHTHLVSDELEECDARAARELITVDDEAGGLGDDDEAIATMKDGNHWHRRRRRRMSRRRGKGN